MLDALLLPERYCLYSGKDLDELGVRKGARFANSDYRRKHWEKMNPGRRPRRGEHPSYDGSSKRKRRKSRRSPTRYLVFRLDGEILVPVGAAVADRPERAKRRVADEMGVAVADLCTVPEHNLR